MPFIIEFFLLPECGSCGSGWTLAGNYRRKGEHERALAVLNRGIELLPKGAGLYEFRGYIHLGRREFGKSLADFNKVIELSPDSADGFTGRAKLYSDLNDFDKAIAEYDKAIGVNPRVWRNYYDRGFIYWRRGEKAKAEADCQKTKEVKRFYESRMPPEHMSDEYCPL